jgi:molybdopterin-guanine dinucleotide biosynthesis protein
VLLEGYKTTPIPKLEVWRPSVGKPMLHPDDRHIVALATDDRSAAAARLPVFDLGDVELIASFVLQRATAWPPND